MAAREELAILDIAEVTLPAILETLPIIPLTILDIPLMADELKVPIALTTALVIPVIKDGIALANVEITLCALLDIVDRLEVNPLAILDAEDVTVLLNDDRYEPIELTIDDIVDVVEELIDENTDDTELDIPLILVEILLGNLLNALAILEVTPFRVACN